MSERDNITRKAYLAAISQTGQINTVDPQQDRPLERNASDFQRILAKGFCAAAPTSAPPPKAFSLTDEDIQRILESPNWMIPINDRLSKKPPPSPPDPTEVTLSRAQVDAWCMQHDLVVLTTKEHAKLVREANAGRPPAIPSDVLRRATRFT